METRLRETTKLSQSFIVSLVVYDDMLQHRLVLSDLLQKPTPGLMKATPQGRH